jgi:cell division protease FtsH
LLLVVGFFLWQGTFATATSNIAITRQYPHDLRTLSEYLNGGRVVSVDLYGRGQTRSYGHHQDPELKTSTTPTGWRIYQPIPDLIARLRILKLVSMLTDAE